jgi:hypothetical protein
VRRHRRAGSGVLWRLPRVQIGVDSRPTAAIQQTLTMPNKRLLIAMVALLLMLHGLTARADSRGVTKEVVVLLPSPLVPIEGSNAEDLDSLILFFGATKLSAGCGWGVARSNRVCAGGRSRCSDSCRESWRPQSSRLSGRPGTLLCKAHRRP